MTPEPTGKHHVTSDTGELDRVKVMSKQKGQHRKSVSTKAIVSFILAFVSLLIGWIVFGIPSAIATVIAVSALNETDEKDDGRILAYAAIAMGLVGMSIGAFVAATVLT